VVIRLVFVKKFKLGHEKLPKIEKESERQSTVKSIPECEIADPIGNPSYKKQTENTDRSGFEIETWLNICRKKRTA
jgi:hypothetical protein